MAKHATKYRCLGNKISRHSDRFAVYAMLSVYLAPRQCVSVLYDKTKHKNGTARSCAAPSAITIYNIIPFNKSSSFSIIFRQIVSNEFKIIKFLGVFATVFYRNFRDKTIKMGKQRLRHFFNAHKFRKTISNN